MAAKADASDNTNQTAAPHEAAHLESKSILTAGEAKKLTDFKSDPKEQIASLHNEVKVGAANEVHKETGSPADIARSDAVRNSVEACKSSDPTCKVTGTELSFAAISAGDSLLGLAKGKTGDAAAASGPDVAMAGSLRLDGRFAPQDRVGEVKPQGSDAVGKPGDNSVREINKDTDNPQAVTQRFDQMVSKLGLPPAEAARMKGEFDTNMEQLQKRQNSDTVEHSMRAMNLMMDKGNYLQTDANRVNAVEGLAARGAAPQEANRQGAHPTCALESESRVDQQRNFLAYADRMGSAAANGGAWMGGADGSKPMWVDINAKGTNGANFIPDAESSQMYSKDFHQTQGNRDYLGQLDNALVGGEMAKFASAKSGKDLVYVAANSQRVDGADMSQAATGGALMERAGSGLQQLRDGDGKPMETPPSTLDMVAKVNHANGGGGVFIQENLAAQFRKGDGSYPEGMNVFHDSADLKHQLEGKSGQEFQIITNGTLVAGRQGHALHVQEISLNKSGNLEMGNNWDDKSNHVEIKPADFAQLDRFTNPNKWDTPPPRTENYPNGWEAPHGSGGQTPQWHEGGNGPMPKDWTKVVIGPGADNTIAQNSLATPKRPDDDKPEDKPKKKADNDSPEHEQLKQTLHAKYLQAFNAARAAFEASKDNAGKEFHFDGVDESAGL